MAVNFFSEKDKYKLKKKRYISHWVKLVILYHHRVPGQISFIFCSDEQLLEINKYYLKHFYYTDVITFNYNEDKVINGDIYISVDRIEENSKIFGVAFTYELYRVMVHGILHLLDFDDKSKEDKETMTAWENFHLNEISF